MGIHCRTDIPSSVVPTLVSGDCSPDISFLLRYNALVIYLFTGTDEAKIRQKAFAWVTLARAKAPHAPYVRLSAKDTTRESLSEVAGTQGLFFTKTLVVLDAPWSEEGASQAVLDLLPELERTENPIAILAPKLKADVRKKLEKASHKVFTYEAKNTAPTRGFNSSLVNALGARNGEALWVEVLQAFRNKDSAEMLFGLLHWKVRDMYSKGSRMWSKDELRTLSRMLITKMHDTRTGEYSSEEALELFALSLPPRSR